jgi:hypothetical protein
MCPQVRPQLQWALENEREGLSTIDLRRAGLRYAIADLTVLIDHCDEQAATSSAGHCTRCVYLHL